MEFALSFGPPSIMMMLEIFLPRSGIKFFASRRFANVAVWLFNILIIAVLFRIPTRPDWVNSQAANFALVFLLLDLTSYTIHRCYHSPFLWRLHRLHHSDRDTDVTTALRVNPAEVLLTAIVLTILIMAFRIPTAAAIAYFQISFVLDTVKHSNVRSPWWLERALRLVFVTPDLHLTHHLADQRYVDTNYGAVFSFWDRLFGTLRVIGKEDIDTTEFGLVVPSIDR